MAARSTTLRLVDDDCRNSDWICIEQGIGSPAEVTCMQARTVQMEWESFSPNRMLHSRKLLNSSCGTIVSAVVLSCQA